MIQRVGKLRLALLPSLVAVLIAYIASGCSIDPQEFPIDRQEYPLSEQHTLVIDFDSIHLELIGHEDPLLIFSGASQEADIDLLVQTNELEKVSTLSFRGHDEANHSSTHLTVMIPYGSSVEVRQNSGSVKVHDFKGHASIDTISAPIQINHVSGRVQVNSRRGTIHISDSDGEMDALAEADEIRFIDVSGEITGTNIMGSISFVGLIGEGDSARLETDHGAVTVHLELESDAQIQITSAGGRIVCTLAGMSGTYKDCEGALGGGAGSLWIRTVSGPIRIDQMR